MLRKLLKSLLGSIIHINPHIVNIVVQVIGINDMIINAILKWDMDIIRKSTEVAVFSLVGVVFLAVNRMLKSEIKRKILDDNGCLTNDC